MTDQHTTQKPLTAEPPAPTRQAYEPPRLIEYGPLRAPIRGVGTQGHDVLNTCDPSGPVDRGC